jgi:hypothetical protein
MPSSNQKLSEALFVKHYDFDPGDTAADDIGWFDASGYDRFLFSFFRTIGTGDVVFKVLGNTATDGTGTDVTIATQSSTATASQPNAVGDYIFIEVSKDDILDAADGTAVRALSASAAFATGTDEGVITYVWGGAQRYSPETRTTDTVA